MSGLDHVRFAVAYADLNKTNLKGWTFPAVERVDRDIYRRSMANWRANVMSLTPSHAR